MESKQIEHTIWKKDSDLESQQDNIHIQAINVHIFFQK